MFSSSASGKKKVNSV
jgi:hypothetical protein